MPARRKNALWGIQLLLGSTTASCAHWRQCAFVGRLAAHFETYHQRGLKTAEKSGCLPPPTRADRVTANQRSHVQCSSPFHAHENAQGPRSHHIPTASSENAELTRLIASFLVCGATWAGSHSPCLLTTTAHLRGHRGKLTTLRIRHRRGAISVFKPDNNMKPRSVDTLLSEIDDPATAQPGPTGALIELRPRGYRRRSGTQRA